MLFLALVRFRNWILSPRANGKPGLIVLALTLWRLRTARYLLKLSRWLADRGGRWLK